MTKQAKFWEAEEFYNYLMGTLSALAQEVRGDGRSPQEMTREERMGIYREVGPFARVVMGAAAQAMVGVLALSEVEKEKAEEVLQRLVWVRGDAEPHQD